MDVIIEENDIIVVCTTLLLLCAFAFLLQLNSLVLLRKKARRIVERPQDAWEFSVFLPLRTLKNKGWSAVRPELQHCPT